VAAAALAAAGLPVVIVNPAQVRAFAKAIGQRAKTDPIDARVIAHFAEATRPEPRPLPDEATRLLADLVARRRQIIDMIGAERQREKRVPARLKKSIVRLVKALEKELTSVEGDIDDAVRGSPAWRETEDLLASVPGVVSASVNLATERARVRYTPGLVTHEQMLAAIRRVGYGAEEVSGGENDAERLRHAADYATLLRQFWFALALTAPLLVQMAWMFSDHHAELLPRWLELALATPVQFWIGRRFYLAAWHALRGGGANMDVLIALGTSAAYLFSATVVLFGAEQHVYFEASAAIITLVLMGRLLEALPERFQDMALLKPPRLGREKPWHQDAAYFRGSDPHLMFGVWIALDPATRENGCMEVIPRSHLAGPAPHVPRPTTRRSIVCRCRGSRPTPWSRHSRRRTVAFRVSRCQAMPHLAQWSQQRHRHNPSWDYSIKGWIERLASEDGLQGIEEGNALLAHRGEVASDASERFCTAVRAK
jgi:copper chaperone CopZ